MTYDPHTDWGMAPVIEQTGTTPKPRPTTLTEADLAEFNAGTERARLSNRHPHMHFEREDDR